MAATVEVNVKVEDAAALAQLSNLDTIIDNLNKKRVNIGSGSGLGGAADDAKDLGDNLGVADNRLAKLGKRAAAVVGAMAAAFVVKGVKSALDTMKDVDTELANIQKVTGESAEAIQELGQRAYDAASQYGVSAKDFLSNAANFAKAGYDNYEQLAELAIETQLVGDVTDDMASKFLLAADAAYKFSGSTNKLHILLDEANEIENNYATSIYKIAQGFPIVANTAAMANMSVEELMAALGTITAKTQQTGSKAATALRALIMNINKEVGEWIDDGEEKIQVTEESVNSLTDALQKYGNAAVQAALETGKVVDPIEALRSLATAWQEGEMTQRKISSILQDLGGKLRADQLTALIENWDTFESMLSDVEDSAGSADKELDVMLGTWESKVNQLSNSWTEFVSHVMDTGAIKGAIETLTSLVSGLDDALTNLNRNQLERAEASQEEAEKTYEEMFGEGSALRAEMEALESHYSSLNAFEKQRLERLKEQEATMRAQVTDAQELTKSQKLQYLNDIIKGDEYNDYGDEVLYSRAQKQLLDFQKEFNEAVAEDGSKNRQQIKEDLQATLDEFSDFYTLVKGMQDEGLDVGEFAKQFASAYEAGLEQMKTATQQAKEEYDKLTTPEINPHMVAMDMREGVKDAASELSNNPIEIPSPITFDFSSGGGQNADIIKQIDDFISQASEDAEFEIRIDNVSETENKIQGVTDALEAVPGVTDVEFKDNAITCKTNVDGLAEAVKDLPAGKTITISIVTVGSLPSVGGGGKVIGGGGRAGGTKNAPGGATLVNELGPELISDNGRAYIANGGKPAIVNLGKGAIVLTAEETRQALGNSSLSGSIKAYAKGFDQNQITGAGGKTKATTVEPTTPQWQEYYIDPNESKKLAEEAQEAAEAAAESWEAIEKRLKEELELLDETAEYYHNFRDHVGEASTYREAIDKLQAAKRQLLDSGYDEMSLEVVSLTNQIFDYGEKFTDATRHFYEDLNDRLSDVLSSLDELAQWYHNQGRHEEEIGVYNAKIEELELAKQKLLESGYAETDKEVLELSNQIFDIEKDIADAKQHAYEEVVDNLDSILSGLEQLEEYYTNQGNFDKVVEVQKQQVAEVYDAIDQLLAQGYDELSTEVVSLLNRVFGLESEIQDAREYEYNKMIGDLEELLRYLDKLADYYHTIGDVDKEIETLERAKAETDAVKKKVKDLGYDELDEKVIDLAKSSYDYSEKIARAKAPSSSGGGSSKDDLNDILKKYDALANYYRNKKDYSSEEATIQEALNELIKRRDKLLKQGYAETSEKVIELANKIFEYEEKVLEARKRSIDDLKDQLSNLDSQIDIAKYQADSQRMIQLQREAQNKIAELIQKYREAGYSDTSDEILGLTKMGYGYAENESSEVKNLWKSLIEALEDMRDTQDDANDLAEKQLAVDEARIALEKAQTQRSVRVFNPVTGQWEWVANAKDIKQAEENLSRAEESLLEKQTSDELALLKQAMENGGSLSGVSIGPGLSALLSGASVEQTNAFATALGALSGGLGLVADTSAKSIFDSVDSHDNVTQYQFNGVSIDTGTAENTTLAELTRMITPLALTNNMPA